MLLNTLSPRELPVPSICNIKKIDGEGKMSHPLNLSAQKLIRQIISTQADSNMCIYTYMATILQFQQAPQS